MAFSEKVYVIKRSRFSVKIDENSPIGLHIRKRRTELKLRQIDAAQIFGVTEESVMYWETGFSVPLIRYMAKIIEFLGYVPHPPETETLGGKIKLYRLTHGLIRKEMGKLLGVDASTIGAWEANESAPRGPNLRRLNEFLEK